MAIDSGSAIDSPGLLPWVYRWIGGTPPANVWLGATIVTREELERDGPKLAKSPAAVRFWSCEPLLEDLGRVPANLLPDWIIAGGESGPRFRACDVEWLRSLKDETLAAGVPLFVKQLGGNPDKRDRLEDLPEDLRIRQWPNMGIDRLP
jgi:protein gp37